MKQLLTILAIACISYTAISQEVKLNTNLVIESDGTVRMDGEAVVWDDLRVPLSEPSTGTVKPLWGVFPYGSSGSMPYLNWFRTSGIDEMYFVVQMPHGWEMGTDIFPHIHWTPAENGEDGPTVPRWGLQYSWVNVGETHSGYTYIYGTTTIPSEKLAKSRHYITPLGTISGEDKTLSSMLICRIFRDGDHSSDTFSGLAGALEVDFHYQIDTFGSRETFSK